MNLLDAMKLYCHIMQTSGGYQARKDAFAELRKHNVSDENINFIAQSVSNEGHLTSGSGERFALTQIGSS